VGDEKSEASWNGREIVAAGSGFERRVRWDPIWGGPHCYESLRLGGHEKGEGAEAGVPPTRRVTLRPSVRGANQRGAVTMMLAKLDRWVLNDEKSACATRDGLIKTPVFGSDEDT